MYDTAHMEMPMYACVQPIKNSVTFGHTKTESICSIYLGKCSGGGTLLTLRRRVGKRVGLFKYPLKESVGLARMAWKRQHEVCDVVQCLAKADLCGTA